MILHGKRSVVPMTEAFDGAIINFFIVAIVVFILVKIINKVVKNEPEETEDEEEVDLSAQYLEEIRDLLKEQAKK